MKRIYLLILLAVSACTTKSNTVSFLDKSSCTLPCWNNIIVGQTTQDEMLQFLETSADIDQKSIRNDNQPWAIFDNHIFYAFDRDLYPETQSDIHVSNNTISDMVICGQLNTTVGDIVEQIGEPEYIVSGDNLDGNRNVILMSPKEGVAYWYTTNPSLAELQYELDPEVEIECLDLFDPSLYGEMMEAGLFSMGHYNEEETLRVMYPWNGYGNLNEKYPPRQP